MGAFAGASYDFVSILSKALEEEKEKNVRIHNEKKTLQENLIKKMEQLKPQHGL